MSRSDLGQPAASPDQQSDGGAAIFDKLDRLGVRQVLRIGLVYLQNLVTHLAIIRNISVNV